MDPYKTLSIQHSRMLPPSIVEPFLEDCERLAIPFEAQETEPEVYAAAEDYIPTAIAVYLAKPFIDAFLKKAGEDGYQLFKKGLAALLVRAREVHLRIMTSGDKKSDPDYPFSRVVSVYSRSNDGIPIKFLFPHSLSAGEYEQAVENLALFIEDFATLEEGRRMGHLILMEFCPDTKVWTERSEIIQTG